MGGVVVANDVLAGRKILITGAASGIALATARLFAANGAALALLDLNAAALEGVASELKAYAATADLRDAEATEAAVRASAAHMGGLDGVVNAAGVSMGGPLETLDLNCWNDVLSVNLTAPYVVCRAALPCLRAAPSATIVNVASGMALLPNVPGASAYAASKAGLIGFTKALAAELGPNIRANVLCPGVTNTPMTAGAELSMVKRQLALQRVAEADEMATAILFLTGNASSFVTGAVLAADGGRTYH
jgi:NAD(P)-dependent dehydrogenase (short-subunit alcohol dehydrogenase family)